MNDRLAEQFLHGRGERLVDAGFEPDPGQVESGPSGFVFYHFTREENLDDILAEGSGLNARLPVPCSEPPDELVGHYSVGGLLEPSPKWLDRSPYFRELGRQMLREYVGGHVAPIVEATREGPGLAVPSRFIEIWDDGHRA